MPAQGENVSAPDGKERSEPTAQKSGEDSLPLYVLPMVVGG